MGRRAQDRADDREWGWGWGRISGSSLPVAHRRMQCSSGEKTEMWDLANWLMEVRRSERAEDMVGSRETRDCEFVVVAKEERRRHAMTGVRVWGGDFDASTTRKDIARSVRGESDLQWVTHHRARNY